MVGIKYGPCKNWRKKKSIVLFGNRQYTLEESRKWTNLGQFAAHWARRRGGSGSSEVNFKI